MAQLSGGQIVLQPKSQAAKWTSS